nr:hypothetical protein [Janibacter limosus]
MSPPCHASSGLSLLRSPSMPLVVIPLGLLVAALTAVQYVPDLIA